MDKKCIVCGQPADEKGGYADGYPPFCGHVHSRYWRDTLDPADFDLFAVRYLNCHTGYHSGGPAGWVPGTFASDDEWPSPREDMAGDEVWYLPPSLRVRDLHRYVFSHTTSVQILLRDAVAIGQATGFEWPRINQDGCPDTDDWPPVYYCFYVSQWWPFGVKPRLSDVLVDMQVERRVEQYTRMYIPEIHGHRDIQAALVGSFNHFDVRTPAGQFSLPISDADLHKLLSRAYPDPVSLRQFVLSCESWLLRQRQVAVERMLEVLPLIGEEELAGLYRDQRELVQANIARLLGEGGE